MKVKNARHGLENPNARYRKEVSVDDVLTSAVVSDPLHLLDICATSDGAAAVVVASTEYAKKIGLDRPVRVNAVSTVTPTFPNTVMDMPNISTDSSADGEPERTFKESIAHAAYEEAGIAPEDVSPGGGLRPEHRPRAGLDGGPRPVRARRGRGAAAGRRRPRSAAGSR